MKDVADRLYDGAVCSPAQNWCRNRPLMEEAAAEIERLRATHGGLAAELRLGPKVIKKLVALRDEIEANTDAPPSA